MSSNHLYTPAITSFPLTPSDLRDFTVYGIIIRNAIILGMDLLPISPIFIHFLLTDFTASTNPAFVAEVAPELSARIATWPPPHVLNPTSGARELNIIFGQDPYNIFVEMSSIVPVSVGSKATYIFGSDSVHLGFIDPADPAIH